MSSTVLPTIVIAVVAGGATAAFTSMALAPAKTDEVAAITPTTDNTELVLEVDALKQENASLLDRIEALEMTASVAGEQRQPVSAEPTEVDLQMKEELEALLASMSRASEGDVPPGFQASVSAALDNIRAAEEAEKEAAREERRLERVEEKLNELAEKLGLNGTQVNDLRDHYTEYEAKRNEMMALARELEDWGSMRDNMRTLRDDQSTALQQIFSPAQYQQYQDENLGGGRRGGFGGGNDGGGGGRGGMRGN